MLLIVVILLDDLLFLSIIKIIGHHKGIFERSKSVVAGVSELWVVLVHLVDWHWFSVEFRESKVTLLENVFLVELRNAFQIRSLPSIKHYLSKVGFVLIYSLGRPRVS